MAKPDNNTYEQVYNIKEDASVTSGVASSICVLLQRGLLVAGFDEAGQLLTMHYTGYNANRPVWEVSFFENLFIQEPLLADKSKVKGVFIGGSRNMIIPDPLYDDNEAKSWFSRIYFVERNDVIQSWVVANDNAKYLLAMPVHISELVKINFKHASLQPLVIHQLTGQPMGLSVQCTITPEEAYITLYYNNGLLWHRVLDHSSGADIAFAIKQFCTENKVPQDNVTVRCNTVAATDYTTVNEMTQYFPVLKTGTDQAYRYGWDGTIALAQQLLSCV